MTPGLALFYGGMVRQKSVLNMMMMSFGALGLIAVLWVLFGYSLAFGNDVGGGLLGSPTEFLGLKGLMEDTTSEGGGLPAMAFVAFQAVFFAVLGILVGGTLMTVKITTDHLLYHDATSTAHSWARFLAASVTDLEQIASGEQPSAASMTFLQSARLSGEVFRYEIFNRDGYSQLVSERDKIALVDLSEHSADAERSIKSGRPIVDAQAGDSAGQPAFFARAYIPVVVNGRPIAVVAAYVDETELRTKFYDTFLIAAAALCLLTGSAFAIPAVAWYRRTKEKQQADRRIRFLAHHDALTGLANRAH